VLEHLAADHQVVAAGRLDGRVSDVADGDAIADFRRSPAACCSRRSRSLRRLAELPQEVHQRARAASEVQHFLRLEHIPDQERILGLNLRRVSRL
jgi:hypothetical protein